QDYGRQRLRRRGLEKVSAEMMLYFLGLNLAKLFRFFQTGSLNRFWKAPEGLRPEEFRKPSARKLSKKGKKINQRVLESMERRKRGK
ncbi:MAG: DDE transposase, partial [bacterium]|nr:DDE transposase [bacterium]